MDETVTAVLLLAAGAVFAFASSALTTYLADRRNDFREVKKRERDIAEAHRVNGMTHAGRALKAYEPFMAIMSKGHPEIRGGFEWDFSEIDRAPLTEAVFRIPNAAVRASFGNAMNLMGGWHTLATFGDVEEDYPFELQRRALHDFREILGACVRGEEIPSLLVTRLMRRGEALDEAWRARIKEEDGRS